MKGGRCKVVIERLKVKGERSIIFEFVVVMLRTMYANIYTVH